MKVIGFIIGVLVAVALGAAFWGWLVIGFLLSILLGGSAKASTS